MSVQHIEIEDQADVGQRLDNFLMRTLKGVPRTHIYKILRSGEVRVNGGRVKAGYRIALSDTVRIPPVRTRTVQAPRPTAGMMETLRAAILYEDDDYLVLNKPAGMAVHGGSGEQAGIVEALRLVLATPRLELVHRLDKETSGVLALAKKAGALKVAQAAFRERKVKKIYQLVVWGAWPGKLRTVQHRLKRYETSWGERRVRVDAQGQQARTDFEVLECCARATLLQARLHTGRTHQIRVHTAHSGHGIVGDEKYGVRHPWPPGDPDSEGVPVEPRLSLHATRLVVTLPDRNLSAMAPLAPDIAATWAYLKHLPDG